MAARVCKSVSHGFAYLQVSGRNFEGERKGQGQKEGKEERILLEGIQRSCEKISYSELLFKEYWKGHYRFTCEKINNATMRSMVISRMVSLIKDICLSPRRDFSDISGGCTKEPRAWGGGVSSLFSHARLAV